jgi:alkylation response protein AidB-like acyl-CoA dehydrogenase
MKLTLTEEQRALQTSARRLFESECPISLVRELRDPGAARIPEKLWLGLRDIGILGLPFDSQVGGEGGSLFDLGLVYQEAGRALCPTAFFSTMNFGLTVATLGTKQQAEEWIPKIASGAISGTTSLWDPSSGMGPTGIWAAYRNDGWRLNGSAPFIADADIVDQIVIMATAPGGRGTQRDLVVLLTPGGADVHLRRMQTFSHDVQCRMTLSNCAVDPTAILCELSGPDSTARIDWLRSASTALQCMEAVGGAQAVLDRTVSYISERTQFGRPIGSFQAAQHHIANMRIAIDAARLTAYQALWWVSTGSHAVRETSIAKLKANDAYASATLMAHQLHGGMGYLRETDLHMWSERAKVIELRGGASDVQLTRLGDLLNDGGAAAPISLL